MITQEQAREYLDSVGLTLPGFLLTALVEHVNSISSCLSENYPPGTALLIQSYLLGILGLAQGDKYVSSQTAPSGASQSFRYLGMKERWSSQLRLLRSLDKFGCTDGLIPDNPFASSYGGLWTAKGGCHE